MTECRSGASGRPKGPVTRVSYHRSFRSTTGAAPHPPFGHLLPVNGEKGSVADVSKMIGDARLRERAV